MNSKYKFLSTVDPSRIPIKSKFNKLTLSSKKQTTVTENKNIEKPPPEKDKENMAQPSTANEQKVAQKPNVLLYETSSTVSKVENSQSILTDDDTDSVGSSVDTNFINDMMSTNVKARQSNRPVHVEEIGTQLKNISISSPSELAAHMLGDDCLARKFTQMEIAPDAATIANDDLTEDEEDAVNDGNIEVDADRRSEPSVVELESTSSDASESERQAPAGPSMAQNVIVLSDTESETSQRGEQNKSPYYNVTESDGGPAVNPIIMDRLNQFFDNVPDKSEDSFLQSNNPGPVEAQESIYISETSHEESNIEEPPRELVEDVVDEAPVPSNDVEDDADYAVAVAVDANDVVEAQSNHEAEGNEEFVSARSDNLQQSHQEGQIIPASASVPEVVAAIVEDASPTETPPVEERVVSTQSAEVINVRQTVSDGSSSAIVRSTGSSIRITSSNVGSSVEKVSISAQININIQISSMDSSSESSNSSGSNDNNNVSNQQQQVEDSIDDEIAETQENPSEDVAPAPVEEPARMEADAEQPERSASLTEDSSDVIAPSEEEERLDDEPLMVLTSNRSNRQTPAKTPMKPTLSNKTTPAKASPRKTPAKPSTSKCHTPAANAMQTPHSTNKLKHFEYVPPKSMTKNTSSNDREKTPAKKVEEPAVAAATDDHDEDIPQGFHVDKSLPVAAKDQILLQKLYGDAWRTPEVIRSYSAIKLKKPNPIVEQQSQSVLTKHHANNRVSRGFNLFKRNIVDDLDSTRLPDPDISIIGPEVSKNSAPVPVPTASVVRSPYFDAKVKVKAKELPRHKEESKKSEDDDDKTSSSLALSEPRASRRRAVKPVKISYAESTSSDEGDDGSDFVGSDDDDEWRGGKDDVESASDSSSSDDAFEPPARTRRAPIRADKAVAKSSEPRQARPKAAKKNDNDLVYLDLTCDEVMQVDENHKPADVSEEKLAEITRQFLADDIDKEKPQNTRRKLFNPKQYTAECENKFKVDDRSTPQPNKSTQNLDEPLKLSIPISELFKKPKFGKDQFVTPVNKRLGQLMGTTPKSMPALKNIGNNSPISGINPTVKSKIVDMNESEPNFKSPSKRTYGFIQSLDAGVSKNLCHPDALIYRNNFNANKEKLTEILYKMFNEQIFDKQLDVPVTWSKKLLTTAGRCVSSTKAGKKSCRIELSEKVVTSADRLRCTLVHELCHAAVWVINGVNESHGKFWKSWASKGNRAFPELPRIEVCHNYEIEYKYTYECNMCLAKSKSHTKSKKVENIRCAICHGSISIYRNAKNKEGNVVQTPVRQASGFAKFVKEKYKDFKRPGVSHGDVMKMISNAFAQLSVEEKKKY